MQAEFIQISSGERQLIESLRTLKPYEEMRIVADKDGTPDCFFVQRTSKIVIRGLVANYVK